MQDQIGPYIKTRLASLQMDPATVAFASVISSVPTSLEVEGDDDTTYIVSVEIAECQVTQRQVFVESRLSYTQNAHAIPDALWFHEFSFTITVVNEFEDDVFDTQDREVARGYIPTSCRPLVLPIVVASLEALICKVRPPTIYRVTKMRLPLAKAMRKHEMLTAALLGMGYGLREEGTDVFGRRFWFLTR